MKILIEALHGLGDTVCILPMISAIKKRYIDSELTILVKYPANKSILEASGINFSKIIVINVYENLINSAKTLYRLRQEKFDMAVISSNTPTNKAKWLIKIIKPKAYYGIQFSLNKYYDNLDDKVHFVEANLLSIKELIDLSTIDKIPHLYVNRGNTDKIKNDLCLLNNITIGLCIGNGDATFKYRFIKNKPIFTRGWGINKMVSLIRGLIDLNVNVILLGGKLEESLIQFIPSELLNNDLVINKVGKTNLIESMEIASICDIVVGIDTGMMHIANALGVKTLSIFGPTNPKTHGAYSSNAEFIEVECDCKYCYGTKSYMNCNNRVCLNNINANFVIQRIKDIIF